MHTFACLVQTHTEPVVGGVVGTLSAKDAAISMALIIVTGVNDSSLDGGVFGRRVPEKERCGLLVR